LRAQICSLQGRVTALVRAWPTVSVSAKEAPGSCELCQGKLIVQKSYVHGGYTLQHGPFEVCETVWECAAGCHYPSGAKVTKRAGTVLESLLPRSTVGYDVMVFVGLSRFLYRQQREEIQSALRNEHGISISTGEVSALSQRFATYMARLHRARAGPLAAALQADGGWPMHVDATGEAGRGTLLVVIAGWRQWVLGAWKISTERADLILPCLRETVRLFGSPCAAMRDLGKAMTPALDDLVCELELTIPVLACHQHFVADVGKDLLEPGHAELRCLFRRAKVRPHLRTLVRDLGRQLGTDIEQARQAVRNWQALEHADPQIEGGPGGLAVVRALAQWTLDFKALATGLDFPFDRPYLDLYDRCQTALQATEVFLRNAPDDKTVKRALRRLHRALKPVDCQVPFQQVATRLRRRAALVDELRTVLRLAGVLPDDETKQDLTDMRGQLDKLVASLAKRRPARGPAQDVREAIDIILTHIDNHGKNLWGHAICLPKDAGTDMRLVARTNFLPENFFKLLKHDERRRSGRKNLGQELEHMPAEAAIVRNLEHSDYVEILCGSLERLPAAFAELDETDRKRKLYAKSPRDNDDDLRETLQLASASLAPADRCVVRNKHMDRRIEAAARS